MQSGENSCGREGSSSAERGTGIFEGYQRITAQTSRLGRNGVGVCLMVGCSLERKEETKEGERRRS